MAAKDEGGSGVGGEGAGVKTEVCGICTRAKVVHGKDKDLWVCRKCDAA